MSEIDFKITGAGIYLTEYGDEVKILGEGEPESPPSMLRYKWRGRFHRAITSIGVGKGTVTDAVEKETLFSWREDGAYWRVLPNQNPSGDYFSLVSKVSSVETMVSTAPRFFAEL